MNMKKQLKMIYNRSFGNWWNSASDERKLEVYKLRAISITKAWTERFDEIIAKRRLTEKQTISFIYDARIENDLTIDEMTFIYEALT